MKTNPTFSIIIPTYNRGKYLRHTLESCRRQTYDQAEFIIRDDASEDDTGAVSSEFVANDGRFRYVSSSDNVGMLENFERALDDFGGDYVLFLGGDDALVAGALTFLAELIQRHPGKVVTWPTAAYIYEGSRSSESQLVIPHVALGRYSERIISTAEFFQRQVSGLFYVSDPQVPMIYVKSAVPRNLLNRVRKLSGGRFFSCSTPDGYSAFALAAIAENYVYITKPISLHGVAPNSAGLNYVQGRDDSKDLSRKFFQHAERLPMSKALGELPYSPLISLMTADFIYKSDEIFNHGFSKYINLTRLIESSLDELCDGLMTEAKVAREIGIVLRLAEHLGLREAFFASLENKFRNARRVLNGDAISSRLLYLRSSHLEIKNVMNAADYVSDSMRGRRPYRDLSWSAAVLNSCRYYLQGRQKVKRLRELLP